MTDRSAERGELVVLLHGLGRTYRSMALPARRLRAAGFRTLNVGYPSRRRSIAELAAHVSARLDRELTSDESCVHFLTHSLGGIVLRKMFAEARLPFRPGRVVMLGPPNQGSAVAERLGDLRIFRALLGPAGQELRAGPDCVPRQIGPATFSLGVIAGTRASTPLSRLIDGPDDGIVGVHETKLEGAVAFVTVHRGHTFLMRCREVTRQVIYFFRHGAFDQGDQAQ